MGGPRGGPMGWAEPPGCWHDLLGSEAPGWVSMEKLTEHLCPRTLCTDTDTQTGSAPTNMHLENWSWLLEFRQLLLSTQRNFKSCLPSFRFHCEVTSTSTYGNTAVLHTNTSFSRACRQTLSWFWLLKQENEKLWLITQLPDSHRPMYSPHWPNPFCLSFTAFCLVQWVAHKRCLINVWKLFIYFGYSTVLSMMWI